MLDASTPPDQKIKKSNKNYNPKSSASRFWPEWCLVQQLHGGSGSSKKSHSSLTAFTNHVGNTKANTNKFKHTKSTINNITSSVLSSNKKSIVPSSYYSLNNENSQLNTSVGMCVWFINTLHGYL